MTRLWSEFVSQLPSGLQAWALPLAASALGALLGWGLRLASRSRALAGWLAKTHTELDDLAVKAMLPYWVPLGLLTGAAIGASASNLDPGVNAVLHRWVYALLGALLVLAVSRASLLLLDLAARRHQFPSGQLSLSRTAIKGAILLLGGLLILSNLGVTITPLLTALGVGSLAVALALQDTLSNLFAGIHILLARPIQVGDFVELESGQKGYVKDIGWRACRILELAGNLIIVPNSRIAQMLLINYHQPAKDLAVLVQAGVSYNSDLEQVERVVVEAAQAVLSRVPGGVKAFSPFVRFHTLADSSINFSVILRGEEYVDRYLITHEFIKEMHSRFKETGIEIPFPQRVLHIPGGLAAKGGA